MALELVEAFLDTTNNPKFRFKWIGAFDINENANQLYKHLFEEEPCAKDLVHIPVEDFDRRYFGKVRQVQAKKKQKLEEHAKILWTMSPPCQPFTLNGNRKDSDDDRSKSFLYLMENLFPTVLPDYIFVENVKNFEISKTRQHLVSQLDGYGYAFEEFLLCPTQLGLVNQRVRYYLIGKRVREQTPQNISEIKDMPLHLNTQVPHQVLRTSSINGNDLNRPLIDYNLAYSKERLSQISNRGFQINMVDLYDINSILLTSEEEEIHKKDFIYINDKQLTKIKGYRYDLIFKSDPPKDPLKTVYSCITKSYGQPQFLRGTGPLVLLLNEELSRNRVTYQELYNRIDFEQPETMTNMGKIRFLHPIEVARLMTFVPWLYCPKTLSIKQQYKLMGNSINVITVSNMLYHLFCSDW